MTNMRLFAILICLTAFTNAAAAKDALPLQRGIFVDEGTSCHDAPTVSLFGYWGNSIGISHDSCAFNRVDRTGNAFVATFKCTPIQTGAPYRFNATFTPQGPRRVVMLSNGGSTTYRWCARNMDALSR
jgi:hypothetical protein